MLILRAAYNLCQPGLQTRARLSLRCRAGPRPSRAACPPAGRRAAWAVKHHGQGLLQTETRCGCHGTQLPMGSGSHNQTRAGFHGTDLQIHWFCSAPFLTLSGF